MTYEIKTIAGAKWRVFEDGSREKIRDCPHTRITKIPSQGSRPVTHRCSDCGETNLAVKEGSAMMVVGQALEEIIQSGNGVCLHTRVVATSNGMGCGSCKKSLVFSAERQMYVEKQETVSIDSMNKLEDCFSERNYSAAEMDKVVKERNEARKELDALKSLLREKDDGHRRTVGRMGDEIGNLKSDYSLLLAENAKLRREVERLNRRLTEATRKKGPYER